MAVCCLLSYIWIMRLPGAEKTFLGCAQHNGVALRIRCSDNNKECSDAKFSWCTHDKQKKNVTKTQATVCVAELGKRGIILYVDLPEPIHMGSTLLLCFSSEVTQLHESFHRWATCTFSHWIYSQAMRQWHPEKFRMWTRNDVQVQSCNSFLNALKPHDLSLQGALFLDLKDLIQVWVMFSRQSEDISGDSVCDISACLILGVCVQ